MAKLYKEELSSVLSDNSMPLDLIFTAQSLFVSDWEIDVGTM